MTVLQRCYEIVNKANKKYVEPTKFTSLQNPYCFITDKETGACQKLDTSKYYCAKAFLDAIALLTKKEKEDIKTINDKMTCGSGTFLDYMFETFRHVGEKNPESEAYKSFLMFDMYPKDIKREVLATIVVKIYSETK